MRLQQATSLKGAVEAVKSGLELTDEQLDVVSGGGSLQWADEEEEIHCPECGSTIVEYDPRQMYIYRCLYCDNEWN